MTQLAEESKVRMTGIIVAAGLLLMMFGFVAILSMEKPTASNPVWFVGLLIIFAAALALIAVVFKWLGLATPKEAFGLPPGSIRTLLAVAVMVLFAVFGLAAIVSDMGGVPHAGEALGNAITASDKVDSEVKRYEAIGIAAAPASASGDGKSVGLALYKLERSRPQSTTDLIKQIITALVTLVTSVVSFYFGSRSAESAAKAAKNGTVPSETGTALPDSARGDVDGIDADLQDIENRLAALHGESATPGNEAALAANLSQADADLKDCKDQRAKLDATTKDLASGNATVEAATAGIGSLKVAVSKLLDLIGKSEALVAKG